MLKKVIRQYCTVSECIESLAHWVCRVELIFHARIKFFNGDPECRHATNFGSDITTSGLVEVQGSLLRSLIQDPWVLSTPASAPCVEIVHLFSGGTTEKQAFVGGGRRGDMTLNQDTHLPADSSWSSHHHLLCRNKKCTYRQRTKHAVNFFTFFDVTWNVLILTVCKRQEAIRPEPVTINTNGAYKTCNGQPMSSRIINASRHTGWSSCRLGVDTNPNRYARNSGKCALCGRWGATARAYA